MGDNLKKDKQNINCNVHSCKHCNCDLDECKLREIEVKNQSGLAKDEKDTICSSYELDKENSKN